MDSRIIVVRDDITTLSVDAVVNAANTTLLGGGGVDGAIHRAAGPALLDECRKLNGCETGQAKITQGYNLPCKYVIHTVGPVWRGGLNEEDKLLRNCYRQSLLLAREKNCTAVAFPNISTGVYRFPKERAAALAIEETKKFLENHSMPETVYFVCFDEENLQIYKDLLSQQ
jgi:O-acetyl-ADP-ribose deacetylase (regulator of RNase III)